MSRNWYPSLWENPHNQHTQAVVIGGRRRACILGEGGEGQREREVSRSLPHPSLPPELPSVKLVSELTPLTVHEGDDATFHCEVSPPDAEVTWLRNGAVVTPGPQLEMVLNGSSRTLIIRGCQLKDAGTVTARAGATDTSARLHVRGLVRLSIKSSVPCNPLPTVA